MTKAPNHVALIPDGNRRWAKERNLPTVLGHREGAKRTEEIARYSRKVGISTLTFWGLSTENWQKRSPEEVSYLIDLIGEMVDRFVADAESEDVRFTHLGRKDRLPRKLMDKVEAAEQKTKNHSTFFLNIALDYGGRDEIVRAAQKYALDYKDGIVGALDDARFSGYVDTKDQPHPNPDLIIRTSGEQRLSGYLLWQSEYAELYFEKSNLPDFTVEKFQDALNEYADRERRFGK